MISVGMLDRSSPVPLHAQLTQGLRVAVVEGRLAAGETLPSTRALADDLGVARGTVVAAYETLVGEGYLLASPGARTVVAELPRSPVVSAEVPGPPAAAAPSVVDLRPGRPGARGLADAAWRSAWRRASAVDPEPDVDDERGMPALRGEIARHLGRTRGVTVDPGDVIITAGTSDALLLVALALPARRADGVRRVGVENPGYPRVRTILDRLGIEMVPLPVTLDAGWDMDAIEQHRDLDAVVVTPHHHYPLGSRLDAAARARLIGWAREHGTVVIEDDYDSEFPHGRAPLPPLRLLDPAGVVLIGTLSKVLTPALRFGWIVASGEMRDRLREVRADLDLAVSAVTQEALAAYLADGSLARHVARRRRDYRHRRQLVLEALGSTVGLTLTAMNGGLHAVALLVDAAPDDESRIVAEIAR
ncbi:PLP-dependent aminotransferase family protein, partial [Microbacterium sp. B19]|uniref:MocR-like pyridoxine biosynthesis transcription factor PdxR n=1 Tax=Microbacterium sp. B19 TaxID=96765 RepID=UPI0003B3CC9F